MATNFQTPNMNLTVPIVGVEPGPDWANDLNASLTVVDSHSHVPGSGVFITPAAMNINIDLSFNSNNAISIKSARFTPQSAPLSGASDLGCIYESGVDLYYNDGSGNQIRITQSGSVAGSAGTITGLPSGTASASYQSSSGTFQFQQATATAANLDIGTIIVRYPGSYPTPAGNYIAIEAPSSLASGYALTLPSLPAANNTFLTIGTSGNIAANVVVDNSSIVISSNQISIGPNANILISQLFPRSAATVTGSLGEVAIGANTGTFSLAAQSPYTLVTNLTVTLTTRGGPVYLGFQGGNNTPAVNDGIVPGNNNSLTFNVLNGSTVISSGTVTGAIGSGGGVTVGIVIPGSVMNCVDVTTTGLPGTYTYTVKVKNGIVATSASQLQNIIMFAYEF